MQPGMILSAKDVKKIIAQHFGVDEDKVISSKYSWIVAEDKDVKQENKE